MPERRGINLNDSTLDKSVRPDELVVGRVVDLNIIRALLICKR